MKKIFLFFVPVFLLIGCVERYSTFQHYEITAGNNKPAGDTIIKDSVHNFYFSRLNKAGAGGLNASCWIGPAHQNKKMWVVVSGRLRTNYAHSNATITMSVINKKREIVLWRAIFLKYYAEDINKWCYFKDSVKLPAGYFGEPYEQVNVFGFLGNSTKENFDLDTLKVDFKEEEI